MGYFTDSIKNKKELSETEMKYQALGLAKEVQKQISNISFIEMLSVMSPDNPAKKEIQDLESKIADLSNEINDFIQKHVADGVEDDTSPEENTPPKKDDKADTKAKAQAEEAKKAKEAVKTVSGTSDLGEGEYLTDTLSKTIKRKKFTYDQAKDYFMNSSSGVSGETLWHRAENGIILWVYSSTGEKLRAAETRKPIGVKVYSGDVHNPILETSFINFIETYGD